MLPNHENRILIPSAPEVVPLPGGRFTLHARTSAGVVYAYSHQLFPDALEYDDARRLAKSIGFSGSIDPRFWHKRT